MHRDALTAPEQRVLGCLIEKRWTTPDQYPLSLNALRLACNQSTNRDPVTDYDEDTVRQAAQRLTRYALARLASGHTSRSVKFRHLAEEGLGLDRPQLAVLAVLLLRGPQTPGEIKLRSERMAPASLAEVDAAPGRAGASEATCGGSSAVRGRRRSASRICSALRTTAQRVRRAEAPPTAPAAPARSLAATRGPASPAQAGADGLAERVATLEAEVAALRDQLAGLRAELGITVGPAPNTLRFSRVAGRRAPGLRAAGGDARRDA